MTAVDLPMRMSSCIPQCLPRSYVSTSMGYGRMRQIAAVFRRAQLMRGVRGGCATATETETETEVITEVTEAVHAFITLPDNRRRVL
jgi:hypothetical protein